MLFILRYLILFANFVACQEYGQPGNASCVSGAHIIVARGSLEPRGPGIIGAVAQQVQQRIPHSDVVSLEYPAIYNPYQPSQMEGVAALAVVLAQYVTVCPKTKIILLGFSQGAHVIADVMCGASSIGFLPTKPSPFAITNNIAAVVLMGDPSTTKGQPFHVGSSVGNGIFPRQKPEGCKCVSDKTVSFCDTGDPFCEAGGHDLRTHMNYVTAYGHAAADYAVSMFHRA
ncbi:related to acetylxylan esterase precursor [Fusarium fujikuroi]|uniref:Related to acetylxylan esterase n=1 Tax=Gibberella fujikuroi (strain CBS 195.34 / IMI 58289 / NRRL A-6831) TaxID=1279085 RepID=S0DQX4_GIBF5|nr:related to acetylxylan esterase precursor [Fusarium fujikuroi IMI 58289]KLO79144.1 acetylxylan esterase precursor [Fusarium fujikuroi]KLO87860.1 acetylxylan esterase precursor [Fusarium fujikuroi]KLP17053.1 acetylxylan esterase precursor [Fusarium fujikuroi]CCT62943.1 related to acetylxylan esterase precursor [Fusarium fujikuroi IMI 58289]SCN66519.1 related to acetylxylan esterase precursor [Fusarium fujikuroi]